MMREVLGDRLASNGGERKLNRGCFLERDELGRGERELPAMAEKSREQHAEKRGALQRGRGVIFMLVFFAKILFKFSQNLSFFSLFLLLPALFFFSVFLSLIFCLPPQVSLVFSVFFPPPLCSSVNGVFIGDRNAFFVCAVLLPSAFCRGLRGVLWPLQKCRGLRECRALAGLSLHCPGVGTVQGHAQFVW